MDFLLKKGLTESEVAEAKARVSSEVAGLQLQQHRPHPAANWTRLNGLAGAASLIWLAVKGARYLWEVLLYRTRRGRALDVMPFSEL